MPLRDADVAGDGGAQARVPGEGQVAEQRFVARARVARQKARPDGEGKRGGLGNAGMEVDDAGIARRLRPVDDGLAALRQPARAAGEACARGVGGPVLLDRRHPGARAGARFDKTFGEQLVVGGDDGVAADLEVFGERACRGKQRVRRDLAVEDEAAQRVVDLAVHRVVRGAVDRQDVKGKAHVVAQFSLPQPSRVSTSKPARRAVASSER